MPARLTFEGYGAGIGSAATVLRANAGAVPLSTPVPTCPGWSVADLVVHQGMVHRWATAVVRGEDAGDGSSYAAQGRDSDDLLGWFDDGATALLQALADAPADLDVFFFLKDAGPARDAWARRQCHESTIHAVDAMAARLGRPPSAAEVWFSTEVALDGIDELVLGFLPRGRTPLRSERPRTIVVAPEDSERRWTVQVSQAPPVTTASAHPDPDLTLRGSARDLYLGLWNRGGEVRAEGDTAAYDLWRDLMKVTW